MRGSAWPRYRYRAGIPAHVAACWTNAIGSGAVVPATRNRRTGPLRGLLGGRVEAKTGAVRGDSGAKRRRHNEPILRKPPGNTRGIGHRLVNRTPRYRTLDIQPRRRMTATPTCRVIQSRAGTAGSTGSTAARRDRGGFRLAVPGLCSCGLSAGRRAAAPVELQLAGPASVLATMSISPRTTSGSPPSMCRRVIGCLSRFDLGASSM